MLKQKLETYASKLSLYLLSAVTLVLLITFVSSQVETEALFLSKKSLTIHLNINSPAFAALEDSQNIWTPSYFNRELNDLEESPLKWGENKNLWVLQNSHLIKYTKNAQKLNAITITSANITNKIKKGEALPRKIIMPEEVRVQNVDVPEAHSDRIKVAKNLLQASWASNEDSFENHLEAILEQEKGSTYQGVNEKIYVSKYLPKEGTSKASEARKANELKVKKEKSYLIKGNIILSEGLAFTGISDQIRIARIEENLILDEGYVNTQEGYFEIKVKELYGYIIAELTDKDDNIRGYAEIDLGSLNLSRVNSGEIVIEKEIKMKPYKAGFNIKAISGASFMDNIVEISEQDIIGDNLNVPSNISITIDGLGSKLNLDDKNKITSDMFTKDSNMLMRLEAKNHWGSLAIGFGETNQKIRMYKNTLVDALISNYKDSYEGYAVIWGRIVDQNGTPIAGAKVELAGDLAIGPLYFNNAHLVDNQLQKTKDDGLFAFIKVLPGLQAVRASVNGRELPIELTVADSEYVSYVEVKQSPIRNISLKSYDPIEKLEVDTSIQLHGSEKIYDVYAGQRNLEKWPGARGLAILESDPGQGYELTRQLINRKKYYHTVPVIKTKWINRIIRKFRLNKDSTKGTIVGFVNGDGFEVFPGRELQGWSSQDIVYFDEKGRVLPKKIGRAGGGFIMYNVPESVTSISLIPKNSNKVFTQLAVTDRYFISTMSADFSNQN